MHKLIRRCSREVHLLASVREYQSVAKRVAHICAGVVVVHIVQHILLHIVEHIGIATLVAITQRGRVIDLPAATQVADQAHTTTAALAIVYVAAIVGIIEEALLHAVVISTYRVTEFTISATSVIRRLGTKRDTRAVFQLRPDALIVHRREGVDIHLATHRVTAIECALRAAQQLNTRHIEHIEVVVVLIKVGHAVHRKTNDRLVDTRTEATNVDRRGHLRAVVGLVEVGHDGREVLDREDALLLQKRGVDNARRYRLRLQAEVLLGLAHNNTHLIDGEMALHKAVGRQ